MMRKVICVAVGFCVVLAIAAGSVSAQSVSATADLKSAAGQSMGSATFTQQADGVRLNVTVKGLPAGKHGIHIHAVGKCDGPDFASAGGHFNPETKQHGALNAAGPHAGDLPNLVVGADGSGSLQFVDTRVTLAKGAANSLFDADASALVIHAAEDDEKTDPSGNSGARIACGLVVASVLPATGDASPTPSPALLATIGALLLGAAVMLRMRQRIASLR
jgi:Cu-Zn family superoxide dismutase